MTIKTEKEAKVKWLSPIPGELYTDRIKSFAIREGHSCRMAMGNFRKSEMTIKTVGEKNVKRQLLFSNGLK